MGVVRALQGLQGTIGQPTAQVIDGSLKFKGGQYLERTSTAGNQTTWTLSLIHISEPTRLRCI